MIRRLVSLFVVVWAFGFAWFAIAMPGSAGTVKTDAVVVLTGGEGRIARGLEVLRQGWSRRLFVSGVDIEVKPREFAAEHKVSAATMACCIELGFESYDTRSNALETARWLARHKLKSLRLITSDWHMRRAALDFEQAKPDNVTIYQDAVGTEPSLRILFLEYHKWLARLVLQLREG